MSMGDNSDLLTRIGEQFGDAIADLVQSLRAYSVTIDSVDDENAYGYMYEGDEPLPIPLAYMQGMFKITPNVGSLSIIQFANGDPNAPFFIAHSEPDKIEIIRGKTSVVWEITPPERDEDGEPIDGETDDVLTLTVDTSSMMMKKDLIEFNGGTLNQMVVIGDLTARLNKMQEEIDKIQTNIASHTHTYIDSKGATAVPTPSTTTATQYTKVPLTQVKDDDYKNDKITQ